MKRESISDFKTVSILILFFVIHSTSLFAATESTEPDMAVKSGAIEFQQRCALCHGNNGRGNGQYTYSLVTKPANLTLLSANNNGEFPFLKVYWELDGRDITRAHGTRIMPIWGDRFSNESWSEVAPEHAETLARGKIFELLLFLYSIQEK